MPGKLYVIGTPIGNLKDVTYRAVETIGAVEILVCEDTRVTSKLVNHYVKEGAIEETPKYFAYNEFNEDKVYGKVMEWLTEGKKVGLVSDAGMPTVSDPGYRIIRAAIEAGLEVEIIPGPTALTTALPWSGLGGEVVLYLGFLPKKEGKARKLLETGKEVMEKVESARVVLYVSPYRLSKDLKAVAQVMGDVRVVLLREMTKVHEERIEGTVEELLKIAEERKLRGEMVLVVGREKG